MTTTKPDSLPLTAPDGEIIAYACGMCRRFGLPLYSLGPLDAEGRTRAASRSKIDADACCVCPTCKKVEQGISRLCAVCGCAERAKWEAELPALQAKQAAEAAAAGATFEKSPDPVAARHLCDHMSVLSEECYCAGWLFGCEFTLWHFVLTGPGEWGMGRVEQSNIDELRALSERCGGWVVWREDIGNAFVPLAEWLPTYAAEQDRAAKWLAAFEGNQRQMAGSGNA